jgi:hypothetical protein
MQSQAAQQRKQMRQRMQGTARPRMRQGFAGVGAAAAAGGVDATTPSLPVQSNAAESSRATTATASAAPLSDPYVIASQGDGLTRFSRVGVEGAVMPRVGDVAPPFSVKALDGSPVSLESHRGKTLVLQFGSLSCPVYRGHIDAMKELVGRAPKDTAFLLVYTTEAHPKGSASPYSNREWVPLKNEQEGVLPAQPATFEARCALAREARARFGEKMPVAVDGMDNAAWKAYGARANSAFVIGPEGRIVAVQEWAEPRELARVLGGH